jgi:hypothetical protein
MSCSTTSVALCRLRRVNKELRRKLRTFWTDVVLAELTHRDALDALAQQVRRRATGSDARRWSGLREEFRTWRTSTHWRAGADHPLEQRLGALVRGELGTDALVERVDAELKDHAEADGLRSEQRLSEAVALLAVAAGVVPILAVHQRAGRRRGGRCPVPRGRSHRGEGGRDRARDAPDSTMNRFMSSESASPAVALDSDVDGELFLYTVAKGSDAWRVASWGGAPATTPSASRLVDSSASASVGTTRRRTSAAPGRPRRGRPEAGPASSPSCARRASRRTARSCRWTRRWAPSTGWGRSAVRKHRN